MDGDQGVPQGRIFGLFLFPAFYNDFPESKYSTKEADPPPPPVPLPSSSAELPSTSLSVLNMLMMTTPISTESEISDSTKHHISEEKKY